MKGTVEVTDLYKGAFLLCSGGRLAQVKIRNNGRRIATFLITGTTAITGVAERWSTRCN